MTESDIIEGKEMTREEKRKFSLPHHFKGRETQGDKQEEKKGGMKKNTRRTIDSRFQTYNSDGHDED